LPKSIDRGGLKSHFDSSRELLRWYRDEPTELLRTDRGRGRHRVDTTINYDAFTFEGV
jgi:hypothetical protein